MWVIKLIIVGIIVIILENVLLELHHYICNEEYRYNKNFFTYLKEEREAIKRAKAKSKAIDISKGIYRGSVLFNITFVSVFIIIVGLVTYFIFKI